MHQSLIESSSFLPFIILLIFAFEVLTYHNMPHFMDAPEGDEYFVEVADVHVCVKNNIQHSKFSKIENPISIDRLESEKHISIDPFSLRESANLQSLMVPKINVLHLPQLHPPTKPNFLSYSLPNSTSSSPKFGSMLSMKKSRNTNQVSNLSVNSFFRQDSIALANLERLRETHLRRSKSCGEGRTSAPPEEFDLWVAKSGSVKHDHHNHKAEVKMEQKKGYAADEMTMDCYNEKVKCGGALCLFLPGFGKSAKPVRARKEEQHDEMVHLQDQENLGLVVSKRVSLEKFECGSWRSSVMLDDCENQKDASNLFFDLPLEMIRCSVSDTHSPVTTAFVFDKDRKGVLKKSSSRTTPRKSPDSARHVRFSTSSPTSYPASPSSCITVDDPLLKAREDFNSFLAAQTAQV